MKPDEIMFFRLCALVLGHNRASVNDIYVRDLVSAVHGVMAYKRCWYLLKKWSDKFGFYNWGVSLDMGWFDLDNLPEQYMTLLTDSGFNTRRLQSLI